jgi:hypothetical protein
MAGDGLRWDALPKVSSSHSKCQSPRMNHVTSAVLIGVGATLVTDIWGFARKLLLGVPSPDYGLVGRWFGHMLHGQFRHASIVASPPIPAERVSGWIVHYLIGIAYAGVLVAVGGTAWLQRPTLFLAMVVGIGSVAAPFLIMQPAMGAGIASSRAKNPGAARLQSLLVHAVFGAGLFVAGWGAMAIASE